jgi:hypothetical protein
MKTKKVVGVLAVCAGALFIANGVSDIQLGFGLVMIVQGILGYPTK